MAAPYNILFLCTGNSARSILAEAVMNALGRGQCRAYSAGSHPKGNVHPMAITVLRDAGYDTAGLSSKSWDVFADPGAPGFDIILTVCDSAAGETCPVWIGQPMTAHWGIADPAAVEGEGQRAAFEDAMRFMTDRIRQFLALPLATMDAPAIRQALRQIGAGDGASPAATQTDLGGKHT